ncbi:hypothetical protein ACPWT1_11740 [Ramlibacter sp. MMS24-I3-19]|uniref:hypothetical protein n=1 Tax=Ramlibacter sp. MMS24-I3-19 TaxID=3416606 RepID=UPI003D01BA15
MTGVTVSAAVAVALLNALLPPGKKIRAVPPAVPLLPSQARKVKPGMAPFVFAPASPRKRTRASGASRRAPNAEPLRDCQLLPPSTLYCHVPPMLPVGVPTTAMP